MIEDWKITPMEILTAGPVIPVIVLEDIDYAVPLAQALLAGGIKVLEVTLRTSVALDAIQLISEQVPEAIVGGGTVACADDLQAVSWVGGSFAISPGLTQNLLLAACDCSIPLIPGISTPSELMCGLEIGFTEFKFFPARAAGGIPVLKALNGPFPDASFCPTGGITPDNYLDYLALENVLCTGGSWVVPMDSIAKGDWETITSLARAAVEGAAEVSLV